MDWNRPYALHASPITREVVVCGVRVHRVQGQDHGIEQKEICETNPFISATLIAMGRTDPPVAKGGSMRRHSGVSGMEVG